MEERGGTPLSETDIRLEELDLERRRVLIAEREYGLKASTASTASWRNPLVIAMMGAVLAGLGNAAVSHLDGKREREIELTKAEHTRILQMIDVDSPDKAAANLTFLIKAGLISDRDLIGNIESYLKMRPEGTGASTAVSLVPRGAAGIVGADDRTVVADPSVAPYRSICQVSHTQRRSESARASHGRSTAILMEDGIVLSTVSKRFAEGFVRGTISCGRSGRQSIANGARPIRNVTYIDMPLAGHFYALFSVDDLPAYDDFKRLPIGPGTPELGATVRFAAYPIAGPDMQVFNSTILMETLTEVVAVDDMRGVLYHYGDTGGGTSGGPLFRKRGNDFELFAIHHIGGQGSIFGKTAFRIPTDTEYADAAATLRRMDAESAEAD